MSSFYIFNRSIPRDYTQTNNWTPQPSTYKSNSKTAIIPAGTYPQQQPYQLPPQQQQQIFLGAYPYSTLPPTVVQVIGPIDHWTPNGYSTPLETYSYPTASMNHSFIYIFFSLIFSIRLYTNVFQSTTVSSNS